MTQPKVLWRSVIVLYFIIGLEILIMISPAAGFFYAAFNPVLLSLAQTPASVMDYLNWATCCYNLVRPHEALRAPSGRGRHRQRTPAMVAGISSRPWQVRELLTYHLA